MATNDRVKLGTTDIEVSAVGTGAWQWGDRFFWGYGFQYREADVEEAFKACVDGGVDFFDTAEIYGRGQSEKLVGRWVRKHHAPAVIATKFMPYPWRILKRCLHTSLRRSLKRLGREQVDLYQIHWPLFPRSPETWAEALADAMDDGLARTVGVSNYSVEWMRRANEVLTRRGMSLTTNQVAYSLLDRRPERNGVLAACREMGVTLIAYSPLAQGILTGKYTSKRPPPILRRLPSVSGRGRPPVARIERLQGLMREIGEAHDDKTQAQVALNWLVCKGALPIPGAKNADQAASNAGAMGWRLTDEEIALLDEESDRF